MNILSEYGIYIDFGVVLVIVSVIQLIKPLVKVNYPKLLPILPLLISAVVPLVFVECCTIKTWAQDTLMYTAGCFISYNIIFEKFLRRNK